MKRRERGWWGGVGWGWERETDRRPHERPALAGRQIPRDRRHKRHFGPARPGRVHVEPQVVVHVLRQPGRVPLVPPAVAANAATAGGGGAAAGRLGQADLAGVGEGRAQPLLPAGRSISAQQTAWIDGWSVCE